MNKNIRAALALAAASALTVVGLSTVTSTSAIAAQPSSPGPSDATMPNAAPSAKTPAVDNGDVRGIAEVGSKMVIGGNFTSVGGQVRNRLAAFDTSTGNLSGSFAPSANGEVSTVLPGPNDNTAYIGGSFTEVNGSPARFVALVDTNTGNLVPGFTPPNFNYGYVNDMVVRGGRLYVAGTFDVVGGKRHAGLVSLNPTSGALDAFMNVQLTGHHNDSGSGAQGWVGPWDLDVSPDGEKMVVIGNFKAADGQPRDQAAMIALSGSSAVVQESWSTSRFSPYCYNWAFDSYVRGVSFSPDGSYFVINSTGGGVPGTLCDATARFETNDTGSDVQPTWVIESGGDTVWGVTVTNTAVYIGGHNRWNNNPRGVDQAQPGAVARPGLAALDPVSGRPLKWNPGRKPLGKAVYAMLATSEGLWIGSNTDWVGAYKYKRPKLAFFPYAGGVPVASSETTQLPGSVYLGGTASTGQSNVLYRVNAGGSAIQSLDSGPDWVADSDSSSDYRNSGSNAAGWSPGAPSDSNVPATTPNAVFDSERWSPSDDPAMNWAFPVQSGRPLQVRLYFANRCTCTSVPGSRQFDVSIDGQQVLDNYDIVSAVGDQTGTMRTFNVTSDGTVNIDFAHAVENPLVNAIEIVRTDVPAPAPGDVNGLSSVGFDGTTAQTAQSVAAGGIDWGSTRGAFMAGGKVFYGYTDGFLYSRSFDGTTFGPADKIDPYHDPVWDGVATQVGDSTFDGMLPSFYGQIPNVTSMFYAGGRLYYTLFGDSQLRWRWFSPDSGIVDETSATVPSSVSFSSANGMFVDSGKLYYGSKADGKLRRVAFSGGAVTGSADVVSGPTEDGVDWRNRAMFLKGGPPSNQVPTAGFESQCNDLGCAFDGSESSDSDGSVDSYAWDFGDGDNAAGKTPAHSYAAAGTYTVKLKVTDNDGGTDTVEHDVTVTAPPASGLTFVGASHSDGGSKRFKQLTVPSAVREGDTMLLFFTRATSATWTGPTGVSGWTQVDTLTNSTATSTVWRKTATAADANATVRMDNAAYGKGTLTLAAYSGVDPTDPIKAIARVGDSAKSDHTTPSVTAGSGNWVVSYWVDKSTATTTWTAPPNVQARDTSTDDSTLRYQALLADSAGPVSAGAYGGLTATTDATSDKAIMWTIALNAD